MKQKLGQVISRHPLGALAGSLALFDIFFLTLKGSTSITAPRRVRLRNIDVTSAASFVVSSRGILVHNLSGARPDDRPRSGRIPLVPGAPGAPGPYEWTTLSYPKAAARVEKELQWFIMQLHRIQAEGGREPSKD